MTDGNRLLFKLFPFMRWAPLTGEKVRADFIAGITIAMVLVPQSMAYAQLAGLPPVYGLYAAFIPGIVGALWGSCAHLSTGPVAMTSLLTAAAMANIAPNLNTGTDGYIALAVFMGLMVGILRLVFGLLKLGFIANFLSQPVIRGFTNAGALIIASSQFDKIFRISTGRDANFFTKIYRIVLNLGEAHPTTLLIGIGSLGIILFCRRYARKLPSALLAAGVSSLLVYLLGLAAVENAMDGVIVVGTIPEGLPTFQPPKIPDSFDFIIHMLPDTMLVMFIGFMEITSVSKAISAKSRQRVDLNQELIGQGLSAIAGSFSRCYPTSGGSFSRSALIYEAGARTGLATVLGGLFVMLTLLFLTPLLYYLPQATLAAIIIAAVMGLIDFKAMVHAWKAHRHDGIACCITFLATLYAAPNMVVGIIIGGALAIVLYLIRTMKPRICVVERHPDGALRDAELHGLTVDRRLPIIRFDGRLYFANVSFFENTVFDAISSFPEASHILVAGEGINEIDASGEYSLSEMHENLQREGTQLVFIGLKTQVLDVLKRTGLYDTIGKEYFFPTKEAAVATLSVDLTEDESGGDSEGGGNDKTP